MLFRSTEDGCRIAGSDGPTLTTQAQPGLLAGVRPEHIRITDSGPLAARVESVEYLGADTVITCTAGHATLVVRQPGRLIPNPGDRLMLAWSASAQHCFDGATGQRRDDITPCP